jgi:hypothetical protein
LHEEIFLRRGLEIGKLKVNTKNNWLLSTRPRKYFGKKDN